MGIQVLNVLALLDFVETGTYLCRYTRFAFYLTDPPLYLRNKIFWKC